MPATALGTTLASSLNPAQAQVVETVAARSGLPVGDDPPKILFLPIFQNMKTVTLKLPDTVDLDDKDVAMLVAAILYEKGKLSLGQAAEMAGLTKRTFAELLGKYGVSLFNYSPSELSRDVKNA